MLTVEERVQLFDDFTQQAGVCDMRGQLGALGVWAAEDLNVDHEALLREQLAELVRAQRRIGEIPVLVADILGVRRS